MRCCKKSRKGEPAPGIEGEAAGRVDADVLHAKTHGPRDLAAIARADAFTQSCSAAPTAAGGKMRLRTVAGRRSRSPQA